MRIVNELEMQEACSGNVEVFVYLKYYSHLGHSCVYTIAIIVFLLLFAKIESSETACYLSKIFLI